MYFIGVLLLLFVLPVICGSLQHFVDHIPWVIALGRWFAFWGAGVRLALAGIRQIARPEWTAREIFAFDGSEALPIIQELGVANMASGIVGLLSLFISSFVLPVAVGAAVFYAGAGIRHAMQRERTTNRNIAMWSDLIIALIFAFYVFSRLASSIHEMAL